MSANRVFLPTFFTLIALRLAFGFASPAASCLPENVIVAQPPRPDNLTPHTTNSVPGHAIYDADPLVAGSRASAFIVADQAEVASTGDVGDPGISPFDAYGTIGPVVNIGGRIALNDLSPTPSVLSDLASTRRLNSYPGTRIDIDIERRDLETQIDLIELISLPAVDAVAMTSNEVGNESNPMGPYECEMAMT